MGKLVYLKDGEKTEEIFSEEDRDDFFERADELIEKDYTVIINSGNILDVDLGKSFSIRDYENLKEVVSSYTEEELGEMRINNHVVRNGLEDYDIYDYGHIKYVMKSHKDKYTEEHYNQVLENRKPIKILDIYARQKVGALTQEEQDMYNKYVNFDLDFLLFSENSDLLTVNTDNSGFITIFEDDIYKNTNTTDAHSETKRKQERWYINKNHKESISNVSIYIFKETMVCYIPEVMTDYQKEELSKIILEVDDLCKFHNKDIAIEVGVENKSGELLDTYYDMEVIKEKFVPKKESKGK